MCEALSTLPKTQKESNTHGLHDDDNDDDVMMKTEGVTIRISDNTHTMNNQEAASV